VHVTEEFKFELTVYVERQRNEVMKSSITGKPIERASLAELEQFMAKEYPSLDLNRAVEELEEKVDPCTEFLTLLLPLEDVKQNPIYHPEGDALYHSLQVFDLAVDALPYDEEFLLAALLHDVGKGIDATDHVRSGVEVLQDLVSERTLWLVEHHMLAHQIQDRTLGARAHRRLRENESYHELVLLGECDRGGRKRGVPTTSLDDALKYISDLGRQ
jgi:hypothetical protein